VVFFFRFHRCRFLSGVFFTGGILFFSCPFRFPFFQWFLFLVIDLMLLAPSFPRLSAAARQVDGVAIFFVTVPVFALWWRFWLCFGACWTLVRRPSVFLSLALILHAVFPCWYFRY